MSRTAGLGGTLFPSRYLANGLSRDLAGFVTAGRTDALRRRFVRWWSRVEVTCGPATGLRALFDVVAMPFCALLGFRASDAHFEPGRARARLESGRGTPIALDLRPWSSAKPLAWRDPVLAARDFGAAWCVLIAPPFVSIVDARGRPTRRSLDLVFPDALEPESFARWWWLARASSFDPGVHRQASPPGRPRLISALERLLECAARYQDGVSADLRIGVEHALASLVSATGHPPFSTARPSHARRGRATTPAAALDEALTIVYRILFLLFAESRDLVPRQHPIYANAYSMATLCREALGPGGSAGLWDGLSAITRLSRRGAAIDDLVVAPFNGRLFARQSAPSLERRVRSPMPAAHAARNELVRRALVSLGTRPGPGGREEIAYADLGVEELGAVYERVLDIDPGEFTAGRPAPAPAQSTRRHSARRKESGTFYTPRALTEFVVRRTLGPLIEGRTYGEILALRVLDPAMGSGAFLVAACRFLSAACERALIDEGQADEADFDDDHRANIRRLVAERCLAGVDLNPVAVELARLSIWLTTLARGKPLGFLDHRLRSGNSLLGASPDDLGRVSSRARRTDLHELPLFGNDEISDTMARLARPIFDLVARRDDSVDDVRAKERLWSLLAGRQSPLGRWRRACSLWCTQWLRLEAGDRSARPRPSPAELRATIDALVRRDRTLPSADLDRILEWADAAHREYQLFHWPLEFPDVFYDTRGQPLDNPGFDAIVGNPPWEMLRCDPGSDMAPGEAGRDRARRSPGTNRDVITFLRQSGLYRNCGRGHLNLYQPFIERALSLTRTGGRIGLVLPWGLASDDGAADLRAGLVDRHGLDTLVGLDNGGGLFPIHRGLRFLVAVTRKAQGPAVVRARFGVRSSAELDDLPERDEDPANTAYPVRLSPGLLSCVGGRHRRLPDARRPGDLALALRLARSFPRLGDANGWGLRFGRELNVTEDRGVFVAEGLPVIEGKHIVPFVVTTSDARHHVSQADAERLLGPDRVNRPRLAYRDVSGVANRLSLIAAVVPAGVVTSHTLYCLKNPLPIEQQHLLAALLNSLVLNAIVRLLMGQHVTTGLVEDLPVPCWTGSREESELARLSERRATGGFTPDTDARLQAGVARLYGLDATALRDIAAGFPRVDASMVRQATAILDGPPVAL